jgi:hypothetical protein
MLVLIRIRPATRPFPAAPLAQPSIRLPGNAGSTFPELGVSTWKLQMIGIDFTSSSQGKVYLFCPRETDLYVFMNTVMMMYLYGVGICSHITVRLSVNNVTHAYRLVPLRTRTLN